MCFLIVLTLVVFGISVRVDTNYLLMFTEAQYMNKTLTCIISFYSYNHFTWKALYFPHFPAKSPEAQKRQQTCAAGMP